MAIQVTHATVVGTADDGTSDVGSDEWNSAHTITGTLPVANGGTGQITEAEAIGGLIQALVADASPDFAADYIATYDASADTGKKVVLSTVVRKKLTADTTFYIRTDGSNSNDGTANTAGGAWLTHQYAYDYLVQYIDFAGYDVVIQVADGTYTDVNPGIDGIYGGFTGGAYVMCFMHQAWVGGGSLTWRGNTTTPANCYMNATGSHASSCFVIAGPAMPGPIFIEGFKFHADHEGINVLSASTVNLSGPCEFATCTNGHLVAGCAGALINVGQLGNPFSYNITGFAARHLQAEMCGVVFVTINTGLNFSGSPSFNAFADAQFNGVIYNNFYDSSTGTWSGISAFCRWGGVISGTGYGATTETCKILEGGTIRGRGRFLDKTSSQTRSSTTALAADSDLVIPIGGNEHRHFKFRVWYNTPTAADFKFDLNGTTASSQLAYRISYTGPDDTTMTTGAIQTAYNVVTTITATTGTTGYVEIQGIVTQGASDGNLQFRWAQDTSNASSTTVYYGSGWESCPLG